MIEVEVNKFVNCLKSDSMGALFVEVLDKYELDCGLFNF